MQLVLSLFTFEIKSTVRLRGSAHRQRFSEGKPLVAAASWSVGGGCSDKQLTVQTPPECVGGWGGAGPSCPPASVSFRPSDFGQVT